MTPSDSRTPRSHDPAETRPRVLLVDDDIRERGLLAELLQDEGLDIVGEAGDGEAGVALAETLAPDVVLMDLRMPVMNGFEATRRIKVALPNTQVIILTAYEGRLPERSAEDVGAYAYLVKGCSPGLVRDVIFQACKLKIGLQANDMPRSHLR